MAEDDTELTVEFLGADGHPDPAPAPAPAGPEPPAVRGRLSRRLVLGILGVVLALVVAGVTGVLIAPDPPTPAPTLDPAAGSAALRFAQNGYRGVVGGSLATDRDEIAALRARVVDVFTDTGGVTVGPAGVIMLWAGDLGGHRYAVTLVPQGAGWVPVVLSGPAGGAATEMSLAWQQPANDGVPTQSTGVFLRPAGAPDGVAFVIAPRVPGIEIATARRFLPGGRWITTWRPLHRQGVAVWAATVTAGEHYLATYRLPGGGPTVTAESVGGPDVRASAQALATGRAAGTTDGRTAVACAAQNARSAGASLAERTALISATPWGTDDVLAVALLRSPDNGWLWGMCDTRTIRVDGSVQSSEISFGTEVARTTWSSADDVTGAVQVAPGRFVVLAPAGADRVRVRGTLIEVRDRLALVTTSSTKPTTLEALTPDGQVIATIPLDPTTPPNTPN